MTTSEPTILDLPTAMYVLSGNAWQEGENPLQPHFFGGADQDYHFRAKDFKALEEQTGAHWRRAGKGTFTTTPPTYKYMLCDKHVPEKIQELAQARLQELGGMDKVRAYWDAQQPPRSTVISLDSPEAMQQLSKALKVLFPAQQWDVEALPLHDGATQPVVRAKLGNMSETGIAELQEQLKSYGLQAAPHHTLGGPGFSLEIVSVLRSSLSLVTHQANKIMPQEPVATPVPSAPVVSAKSLVNTIESLERFHCPHGDEPARYRD